MPRKEEGGIAPFFLKCKLQGEKKEKNNNTQNVYIIWIQHRKNSEMWSCISNDKRSSHFKASCLPCEFICSAAFYLAKHTNKDLILTHTRTPLPVMASVWKGSLDTHSVHMAEAAEGIFTQVDP